MRPYLPMCALWAGLASPAQAQVAPAASEVRLRGFVEARLAKGTGLPPINVDHKEGSDPQRKPESQPLWFGLPEFRARLDASARDRLTASINLWVPAISTGHVESHGPLSEAWVDTVILPALLSVRLGLFSRPFGLYGESYGRTALFLGVEPPEYLDRDHPLLTRATHVMLHGAVQSGGHALTYSAMTGREEVSNTAIPLGVDLRYTFEDKVVVGTSLGWSGGRVAPASGSDFYDARGGAAPWARLEEYLVYGGFGRLSLGGLRLEAELFRADHSIERDPVALEPVCRAVPGWQWDRLRCSRGNHKAYPYTVTTGTVLAAYVFEDGPFGLRALAPYVRAETYRNPETVRPIGLGGDEEAGLTSDGRFDKYALGLAMRPTPALSIRIEECQHRQSIEGKDRPTREARLSLTYAWDVDAAALRQPAP